MDEVQIEVLQSQSVQRELEGHLDIVGVVEARPELARHEDLLPLNAELLHGLLDALPNLGLVFVDVGAVDVAVADLQGVLDGGRYLAGLRLPGAEAQDGEVVAAGQFDGGNHFDASCGNGECQAIEQLEALN